MIMMMMMMKVPLLLLYPRVPIIILLLFLISDSIVTSYKQGRAECGVCAWLGGGAWGGISAGPRGLFSAVLAVAIVLMMVC